MVEEAALSVLGREDMGLADLAVPGTPEIHFEPEERPLLVHPGRLAVGEARPDELNRGRLRVNVAFTLPPGAYATLVVKRLFHWALEPARRGPPRHARPGAPAAPAARKAAGPPAAEPAAAPPAPRRPDGFLARGGPRRKPAPPGARPRRRSRYRFGGCACIRQRTCEYACETAATPTRT